MRNSSDIQFKVVIFSLLSALLASNQAQAKPPVYSKTLTFTQSTTTPAPPAPRTRYYFPANTKYSNVRVQRAETQVAVESLEIAHEGFGAAKQNRARVAR